MSVLYTAGVRFREATGMGLNTTLKVTCDRCAVPTSGRLTIVKLKPALDTFLNLPKGWAINTKSDSLELYILCPKCQKSDSLIPVVAEEDIIK